MSIARFLPLTVVSVVSLSCYTASFNEEADGVFACSADADCPGALTCIADVCVDGSGPGLLITAPEDIEVFSADTLVFELKVIGAGADSFVFGQDGKLRVFVDGTELAPVESGDLRDGITLSTVDIPEPTVGPHRVRAILTDADGEPSLNPDAVADVVFFVADPSGAPQLAVVEPFPVWPSAPLTARDLRKVGEPFDVVIAGNGFTWTNPTDNTDQTPGQHHTHVFTLSEYPACLPGCNNDYVGSLKPAASTTSDDRMVDGVVASMLPTAPTRMSVTAGLQWNNHVPYPAASENETDWDATIRANLVNDTVEIEFFE